MNSCQVILVVITTVVAVKCCTLDTECSITDSICSDEECVCKKGFLLNSDGTKCLPYVTAYYGECSENAQCEWLGDNNECTYVCKCKEGYRWYQGQCLKYSGLGGDCSEDIDCYDGYNLQSLICTDQVCSCNDGYYRRADTDCRKIASQLNDTCALDIDCQVPNEDTICHIGKCQRSSEFPDDEEAETPEETYYVSKAFISLKECSRNSDCDIPNSECYEKTGTCICKKQYFFDKDGTTCIPELGVDVKCQEDDDCVLKPGKCENGVCFCRDYYFVEDGNRNCIKTMSEKNHNCVSKEWCYALGSYSYCTSNETCECSRVAELDSENLVCDKTSDYEPDMCRYDYECKRIQNGYCVDEACGCRKDNVLQENRCIPDIGGQCGGEALCEIENSECRDGHCQCIDNYVAFEKKACYIKRNHLGDQCEVDLQCAVGVTYSECVDSQCSCGDHYLSNNNKCYPKKDFGDYCNNRLECSLSLSGTIKDVVCRNHECQCSTGYTLDGDECSSSSTTLANLFGIVVVLLVKVLN